MKNIYVIICIVEWTDWKNASKKTTHISCGSFGTFASRNVYITPVPTNEEILLCELEMEQFPFELDIMQLLLNGVNDQQTTSLSQDFHSKSKLLPYREEHPRELIPSTGLTECIQRIDGQCHREISHCLGEDPVEEIMSNQESRGDVTTTQRSPDFHASDSSGKCENSR